MMASKVRTVVAGLLGVMLSLTGVDRLRTTAPFTDHRRPG